jgi:hypothetical protein
MTQPPPDSPGSNPPEQPPNLPHPPGPAYPSPVPHPVTGYAGQPAPPWDSQPNAPWRHPPYPGSHPWPTPHEHAAYWDSAQQFRSAKPLAVAAAVLAGLVALIETAEAVLAWPAARVLQDAAAQGVAAWNAPLTLYDAVVLPLSAIGLVSWLVTALWLTRTRRNAQLLRPRSPHTRSTVWAWLGWWVPVVAYWFPFQVVRDIRRATLDERHRTNTVVGWWWALWLLYTATTQAGVQITTSTEPNADLAGALGAVESTNAVFAVAALLLWVRIIVQITHDQQIVAVGSTTTETKDPAGPGELKPRG